jgi:hypothetical protein
MQEDEKRDLIKLFPNDVELSYETSVHKKVYNYNYIIAIPEGKKGFVWFVRFKNRDLCVFMEFSYKKEILFMEILNCDFQKELGYGGTIFYGTRFLYNNLPLFSLEDIFYYKGRKTSYLHFNEKLLLFETFLKKEIIQNKKHDIFFGLPIFFKNVYEILDSKIIYKIKTIQFRDFKKQNGNHCLNWDYQNFLKELEKPKEPFKKREIVFLIRPDIQNDIYYLYFLNHGKEEMYDVAYIPDFKTSVFMNSNFRNIKENHNLDFLEESDDDEEFEKECGDKFVFLERKINMVCQYNHKFKKWEPLRLASPELPIVSKNQLIGLEKNKY